MARSSRLRENKGAVRMGQILFSKVKIISRIITLIFIFIVLCTIMAASNDSTIQDWVGLILITSVEAILLFGSFIILGREYIYIVQNGFIRRVSYSDIFLVQMGLSNTKVAIPSIEIVTSKKQKMRRYFLYYLQYEKEELNKLLFMIKEKNDKAIINDFVMDIASGKKTSFCSQVDVWSKKFKVYICLGVVVFFTCIVYLLIIK